MNDNKLRPAAIGLRPFILRPAAKDYLWGGQRLNTEFGKGIDLDPLAETWECSTHPDGPSIAATGEFAGQSLDKILREHPEMAGTHPDMSDGLPVLIKLIDAREDLSVQVHPNDEYAREHENGQRGKTELWYVLDAREDARLVYGLSQAVGRDRLLDALRQGTVGKYLRKVPVRRDDVFFVEAGTIHALGAGCLIAEIQESSNITYRLYDYDRAGKDGKKRPLHIQKALDVARLEGSDEPRQPMRVLKYRPGAAVELLCRCGWFEVSRLIVNTREDTPVTFAADSLSFRVLLCTDGEGTAEFAGDTLEIKKGQCMFVPASSVEIHLRGRMTFLDVRC